MYTRPDFDGFGFSMRANERGPHQISSVEPNSPAQDAGLRIDDLILKVNDQNVVGERYSKTVALIKNESERGRGLKLEVVDPTQCPPVVRDTLLNAPSTYSTMSSTKPVKKADSTQNLKMIATEARDVNERPRAVSVDAPTPRPRPLSQPTGTVTSATSMGSGLTGTLIWQSD